MQQNDRFVDGYLPLSALLLALRSNAAGRACVEAQLPLMESESGYHRRLILPRKQIPLYISSTQDCRR